MIFIYLQKLSVLMPQLIPFYFINQVTFAFIILIIMIYIFSKNILPRFIRLFLSRIFIVKL
jgi:F-type H+-transporting ATPase subunit 8